MDFIPLSSSSSKDYWSLNRKKKKQQFDETEVIMVEKKRFKDDSMDKEARSSSKSDGASAVPLMSKKAKMKDRIMDYLEKNSHREFIDIEHMAKYLHTKYPDYSRRKLVEFHAQVSFCFENMQACKVDRETIDENDDSNEIIIVPGDSDQKFKVQLDEDTRVHGPSINQSISDLYGSNSGLKRENEPEKSSDTSRKSEYEKIQALASSAERSLRKKVPGVMRQTPKDTNSTDKPKRSSETNRKSEKEDQNSFVGRVIKDNKQEIIDLEPEQANSPAPNPTFLESENSSSVITPSRLGAKKASQSATSTSKKSQSSKNSSTVAEASTLYIPAVPSVTFQDIGGCETIVREVFQASRHVRLPQVYRQLGVPPPRGFLIHGPPGCGKTMMAKAVAGSINVPMITITGTELISGISGDSEGKIRTLFDKAKANAPCILFIDGIDVIAKRRENAQRDMEVRVVSQLLSCLDDLTNHEAQNPEQGHVFVIGATDRLEAVEPALRTGSRLGRDIAMGIPDAPARHRILKVMTSGLNIAEDVDMLTMARLTPGYVGSDLKTLITTAASFAEERFFAQMESGFKVLNPEYSSHQIGELLEWASKDENAPANDLHIVKSDFEAALKIVQPSAKKEGFATVPNVSFEDIGALDNLRHELIMSICVPVQRPELIQKLGLDVPSGVLLCGPPGCGKTLLAKAVANQAGINFISVKGPEILNMYVGESERAVRQVFARARNSAPCVIFFDEIDSICPRRGRSDSGGSNRLVNQLLTEMDGVEGRAGVYVMGATNRVDMLDEAILRPGRLTNIYFVDLPTPEGREDILRKLTKNGTKPALSNCVDLGVIARSEKCEGFSGADLGNLVRRAAQFRLEDICRQNLNSSKDIDVDAVVGMEHFERAFEHVKPSVTGPQKRHYELLKKKYGIAKSAGSSAEPPQIKPEVVANSEPVNLDEESTNDPISTGDVEETPCSQSNIITPNGPDDSNP